MTSRTPAAGRGPPGRRLPTHMRAIAYSRYGGPDVLELTDLPDPKVGPDSVLVRVRATSVNPVDWKVREGYLDGIMDTVFPAVPGWDVAGVVEQIGLDTPELSVGDEVYGYVRKDVVSGGTRWMRVEVDERQQDPLLARGDHRAHHPRLRLGVRVDAEDPLPARLPEPRLERPHLANPAVGQRVVPGSGLPRETGASGGGLRRRQGLPRRGEPGGVGTADHQKSPTTSHSFGFGALAFRPASWIPSLV